METIGGYCMNHSIKPKKRNRMKKMIWLNHQVTNITMATLET